MKYRMNDRVRTNWRFVFSCRVVSIHPQMNYYLNLLKQLREKHPSIDLDCFSPIEIEALQKLLRFQPSRYWKNFSEQNAWIPGGAEMLVDKAFEWTFHQKRSSR